MKKEKFKWLILLLIGAIIGGMFMFHSHQKHDEELKRNREYEVSLVNALKNSYEGIEKIRITDPYYTDKPDSWSCDVEITFHDGDKILYGINHQLDFLENYDGLMKGRTDDEINQQWKKLRSHKGKTVSKVKVIYSDKKEGLQ